MMSFKRLLTIKGLNLWYLASAIGLNLFWTLLMALVLSTLFLKKEGGSTAAFQLIIMACSFLGPFVIAWVVGKLAADGRGPTYGVYGSFGSISILVIVALPTGVLGLMLIVAAFAGGLNGGLYSLQRR
jgi:hypothetical protein